MERKSQESVPRTGRGEGPRTERMIVAGGSFIRAQYRLPPLSEDIKNAIVALFQFLVAGQRLNGPVSVDALDSVTLIHTAYGDVSVNRVEHPVNRRLQTKYIFTVPLQFFIKGRRTDGRFYREMEAALRALAECRFTFVDSSDGLRHTTNTGIINDPETLSPLEGADGRNTIVTFSMTRSMLEVLFDASCGFHRFIEADCMALTSIYAKRLYELLCGWDGGTVYRMEVGRFKEMFCITGRYAQLSDLRKRVLEPAVKEINGKTGLTVGCSVEKGALDAGARVIEFRVLRNSALLAGEELSRKYVVWPEARLMEFLTAEVKMRRGEIRPHALLFHKVSSAPAVMAELPRKWEKTLARIPAAGTDRLSREKVRRERVAHFVASVRGMVDDCGL